MAPRVSVLVPFYNQVGFATEAVQSVLAQDYRDFELILADDASSDVTVELLERLAETDPELITLLRAPHNRGIAGNFNAALAAAQGELVAWLGGDDVMLDGKLSRQVRVLDDHPEAVACVHDAEVFESASGEILGRFSELYNGRAGVRSGGIELQFDPTYFMLPSATMFRRQAAPAHGFDQRLRFANDWLWTVELLRHGTVIGMQDVLVRYRRHGANITADAGTRARVLEEGLIALAVVDARYPELHGLVRQRAAAFHMAAAWELAAGHHWRQAGARTRVALAAGGPVSTVRVGRRLLRARRQRGGGTP